ncbi:hypothetical protein NBRC116494_19500 [Aurantivibrio plasticivorans]
MNTLSKLAWFPLLVVFGLAGCDDSETKYIYIESEDDAGSGQASFDLDNLPGTWLYRQITGVYNVETDELLYTSYDERPNLFRVDDGHVFYSECLSYETGRPAIATDNFLYLNGGTMAFEPAGEGMFRTISSERWVESWNPDPSLYYLNRAELIKVSEEYILDAGLFTLGGGSVSITEYDHVCLSRGYNDLLPEQLWLSLEFLDQGERAGFDIAINERLVEGSYSFDENVSGPIEYISFKSNSAAFESAVGDFLIFPAQAEILITASDEESLMGAFSFEYNDVPYSGEFHFLFEY